MTLGGLLFSPVAVADTTASVSWTWLGCGTTGSGEVCDAVAEGAHHVHAEQAPATGELYVEGGFEDSCDIGILGGDCATQSGTKSLEEGECKTATAETDADNGEDAFDDKELCNGPGSIESIPLSLVPPHIS